VPRCWPAGPSSVLFGKELDALDEHQGPVFVNRKVNQERALDPVSDLESQGRQGLERLALGCSGAPGAVGPAPRAGPGGPAGGQAANWPTARGGWPPAPEAEGIDIEPFASDQGAKWPIGHRATPGRRPGRGGGPGEPGPCSPPLHPPAQRSNCRGRCGADPPLPSPHNPAEGEADPLAHDRLLLRHRVQPVVLAGATHYQQAAMTEPISKCLFCAFVLQDKLALRSE